MSLSENIEDLIDSGQYLKTLESLRILKETVQNDSSSENYNFLAIQHKIAEVLSKQGYYEKALNMFTGIYTTLAEFGDKYDQEIMAVKENIGNLFVDRREYDNALNIFEEIYKYRCDTLGLDNPLTFQALRNLAVTLASAGIYDEAMISLKQVYEYRLLYFGIDHKIAIESSNDIAIAYLKQREYDKALRIFEETYKYLEHKRPQDWDTLLARCHIANILKIQGKYNEAFTNFGEVYLIQTKMKPLHTDTLRTLRSLAELFEIQGEDKTALLLMSKIYCVRSSECPMHPDTIDIEKEIASVLLKQEKLSSALYFFNLVLIKISVIYGIDHGAAVDIQKSIALELYNKKVFGEALKVFKSLYKIQCEMHHLGPKHPDTLLTKIYLGRIYLSLSKFNEAVKAFNDVLKIVETRLGPYDADYIVAENNIAEICKLQKKFEAHEIHNDFFETQLLGHPETLKSSQKLSYFQDCDSKCSMATVVINSDLNNVKFPAEIRGADVNARDSSGCTALHISSERGDTDIVKYLLGKGAIYNIRNKDGKTPMDIASNDETKSLLKLVDALFVAAKEGNFEEVFRVVKEKDSIASAKDENGNTLLHIASVAQDFGAVKFLLNSGADPTSVNNSGDTPLLAMTPNHYKDITADLLKHMLKTNTKH